MSNLLHGLGLAGSPGSKGDSQFFSASIGKFLCGFVQSLGYTVYSIPMYTHVYPQKPVSCMDLSSAIPH